MLKRYCIEDIQIGMESSFEIIIDSFMQYVFTQLTGDINPLHVDKEFAISRGYKSEVVYGMLTAAFYSKLVGVYMPGENCIFHEIHSTFMKPVYIGDKLKVGGVVEDIRIATKRLKIRAEIRNDNNEIVNKAVLTVGFSNKRT